jgi:ribosomal protein S18 acetylase RimI-like enzyme
MRKLISPVYVSITDLVGVNDLRQYDPSKKMAGNTFLVRQIVPGDLDKVRADLGVATANRFSDRLTSSKGYIALDGDLIAGWLWITDKMRPKEGVYPFFYKITPPKGSVYIFDGYTVSAARKRGVMKVLVRHLLFELKQAGVDYAIFTYDHNNIAIERLLQTHGFSTVGTLTYRRYLWWVKQDTSGLENICVSN